MDTGYRIDRLDVWMKKFDEWKDGQVYVWLNAQMLDGQQNGWMDRWMKDWEGWKDDQVDVWLHAYMLDGQQNGRLMDERLARTEGWILDRVEKRIRYMYERME